MTTNEPTTRKRPKERKTDIVANARRLFVEHGYQNVSMAAIAESVGITAGALYRHFANKAVLLEAVFDDSFGYLDNQVSGSTFDEIVDDALAKADQRYTADLWSREVRHLPEDSQERLRSRMRAWTRAFVPPLHRLRDDLEEGQDDLIAWALQSLLSGLGNDAMGVTPEARRSAVRRAMLVVAHTQLDPMGGNREPHQRRFLPSSMRERLLLAAIDEFGQHGYGETSLATIGAAVDVTGQNLYGYFDSKATLWRAVVERGIHAAWIGLEDALSVAATPTDALAGAVRSHLRLAHPWTEVRMPQRPEDDLTEYLRGAQREYLKEWVWLIRQIQPSVGRHEARLRVLLAFMLISDLRRTPHLASFSSFESNVCRLALKITVDADG